MRNYFKERPGLPESLIFMTLFAFSFFIALNWSGLQLLINPPVKRVHLENVAYESSSSIITGYVADAAEPDKYGIIAYIKPASGLEYFPKPSEKLAVTRVSPDGGYFEIKAYTPGKDEANDKAAEYFCLLVVPAEFDYGAITAEAAARNTDAWELTRLQATYELWDQPTGNAARPR